MLKYSVGDSVVVDFGDRFVTALVVAVAEDPLPYLVQLGEQRQAVRARQLVGYARDFSLFQPRRRSPGMRAPLSVQESLSITVRGPTGECVITV